MKKNKKSNKMDKKMNYNSDSKIAKSSNDMKCDSHDSDNCR